MSDQMSDAAEQALDEIYGKLPLGVRLLGRDRLKKVVAITIKEWPSQDLCDAAGEDSQAELWESLEEQVRTSYVESVTRDKRYGFAILSIILVSAISAIVQQLVIWWLNRPKNREIMASWQSQQ